MRYIILLSSILLTFACADDNSSNVNACTSSLSIEEVPWLLDLKNSMTNCACEISLIKGTYDEQTVFFIALTDPLCDGINTPTLYNCEGGEVRTFTKSAADQMDLYEKVTTVKVIYRCKYEE